MKVYITDNLQGRNIPLNKQHTRMGSRVTSPKRNHFAKCSFFTNSTKSSIVDGQASERTISMPPLAIV